MWCKNCNRFTYEDECEVCGAKTQLDIPTVVYWCDKCQTPIIKELNDVEIDRCPICGGKSIYLCKDLRPVFPEERLLIEILRGKPFEWQEKSVWAQDNKYYVGGKAIAINFKKFDSENVEPIIKKLKEEARHNSYEFFNKNIKVFCDANVNRLSDIEKEARGFISTEANKRKQEQLLISFSGGKDSTVVADLVVRELSNPSLVHIFGDTTLEFPMSYDYVQRYKKNNPKAIVKTARNKEQIFYEVCKDIGPPARMMRWCCTMFKTGPITRAINSLFKDQKILTFYGIRKSESLSRSKYDRVANGSDVKIQKQTVASPIFYWSDLEIWLYLLSENVDFNDSYRLGYDRVGCWCCPNNNVRAQFLAKIYMPEEYKKWRDYLLSFAKSIGKPDPEEYVDGGWWKARQGGNGLPSSEDVKIKFTNCTAEENAKVYKIVRPIDDSFYELFVPFGKVSKELGRKLINEVIVLDVATNVPILSLQPFVKQEYEYAVKVKTLNVASHDDLQRMVGYQIRKFNACRKCLKCESVCSYGAISITKDGYHIDENKCKHCKKCVTAKYLSGGCLMDKFLKVRIDYGNK